MAEWIRVDGVVTRVEIDPPVWGTIDSILGGDLVWTPPLLAYTRAMAEFDDLPRNVVASCLLGRIVRGDMLILSGEELQRILKK